MSAQLERLRQTEIWIAWVRVLAVPLAAFEVAIVGDDHPPGYERWGWATAAALMFAGNLLSLVADPLWVATPIGFVLFIVVLAALGMSLWRQVAAPNSVAPERLGERA